MSTRDPLYRDPLLPDDDLDASTSIDPKIPQHTDDAMNSGAWETTSGAPIPSAMDDAGTQDKAGKAKDKAKDVAGKAQEKASDIGDKAEDLAGKAQGKTEEVAGQAQEKADQGMDAAASGLGQAADMLRDQGEQRGGGVGTAASKTADTLESASQYLRDKDSGQLMDDLETFVREKPIESVAIAAGVGFLLSKIFS